jgi:hypothetical protein
MPYLLDFSNAVTAPKGAPTTIEIVKGQHYAPWDVPISQEPWYTALNTGRAIPIGVGYLPPGAVIRDETGEVVQAGRDRKEYEQEMSKKAKRMTYLLKKHDYNIKRDFVEEFDQMCSEVFNSIKKQLKQISNLDRRDWKPKHMQPAYAFLDLMSAAGANLGQDGRAASLCAYNTVLQPRPTKYLVSKVPADLRSTLAELIAAQYPPCVTVNLLLFFLRGSQQ